MVGAAAGWAAGCSPQVTTFLRSTAQPSSQGAKVLGLNSWGVGGTKQGEVDLVEEEEPKCLW